MCVRVPGYVGSSVLERALTVLCLCELCRGDLEKVEAQALALYSVKGGDLYRRSVGSESTHIMHGHIGM